MEVILLENIPKTGRLGDTVEVKAGYARNYLLPYGKAIRATEANKQLLETKRHALEEAAQVMYAQAQQRAQSFTDQVLVVMARASEEGRLYGSVGPLDIVKVATEQGLNLAKKEVLMSDGPIHMVGQYTVKLRLHHDVMLELPVQVKAA